MGDERLRQHGGDPPSDGIQELLLGIAWNGVAIAVTRLAPGILTLILAWSLDPWELGAVSFVLAYYGILVVVADCGLAYALQKFIPESPEQAGEIAWTALIVRFATSILLGGICWVLDLEAHLFRGYGRYLALLLVASAFATIAYIHYANHRFREGSLLPTSINIAWLILALVLVRLGLRMTGPLLGLVFAYLLLGTTALALDSNMRRAFAFVPAIARRLVQFGLAATLASALSGILLQVGVLAVTYLKGEAFAAVFKVALTLAAAPALVGITVLQPLLPTTARSLQHGGDEMPRTVRMLIRYLLLIGLPMLGAGLILARPLLQTFFSPTYLKGDLAVGILLAGNTCIMFFTALSAIPFMGGGLKDLIKMNATAATLALLGSLFFIRLWGITGAAVAQMLASGVGVILMVGWLRKRMLIQVEWSRLAIYSLSAAEMSLVLFAIVSLEPVPRLQLVLGIPMGLLTYVAALYLHKGISVDEIRLLIRRPRPIPNLTLSN
jgi:O-antigen/teichoic acid export membrane protein